MRRSEFRSADRVHWLDVALVVLLFAATVGYLAALPLNVGSSDEGHQLHAAKRVLEGEVIYRDIFDLSTPGWTFLMAGIFGAFGTTLATARFAVALIHGGTAVLMFVACRLLGVRRGLAWACALAYLVACQPIFPVASYHWLATFLTVALLVLCLRASPGASWAFLLGAVVGVMIAVHQQRGFSIGLAVGAFIASQGLIQWRFGAATSPLVAVRPLLAFGAGVGIVVGALGLFLVATAGIEPVWSCLIVFPLVNYRSAHTARWGVDLTLGARSALSRQLKYLPLIALAGVPALATLWWRKRNPERVRELVLLLLFCASSVVSILYFPDAVHIALIAPIFLIATAVAIEWALHPLPQNVHRALGAAIAAAVLVSGGVTLQRRLVAMRTAYPVHYQTAFGEIAFEANSPWPQFWDQLMAQLDASHSRSLFFYPIPAYNYLISGAHNPTRFSLIVPGPYTPPAQIAEIVSDLAAKRVDYVVAAPGVTEAKDPIAVFIREHYRPVDGPQPLGRLLWRRNDESFSGPQGGTS